MSETSATQIHLIYETAFYTEFSSGQWTSANATTVKTTIASRVLADFATYGVNVSESSGDIAVYIGASTLDGAYGKAITGVGSYYYNDTPYVEIYTAKLASDPAWQGANATSGRIAEALSGTINHEVGHIFNLYHVFMYDAYDPFVPNAVSGDGFPVEPSSSTNIFGNYVTRDT